MVLLEPMERESPHLKILIQNNPTSGHASFRPGKRMSILEQITTPWKKYTVLESVVWQ